MNPSYPCPKCRSWVEILPTTTDVFDCPWCSEPLEQLFRYKNGMPPCKLVSKREHIEKMIERGKEKENYHLAPDEARDAYINDCDAGSGE